LSGRLANRRIRLLLALFAIVFGATLARAVWLQGVRAQSLGRMAASQHRQTVTVAANRGTIYDSTGVQLAIGEQAITVYADPLQIRDATKVAPQVARILRLDPKQVYEKLTDRAHGFVYVERKADAMRAARLERLHIPGLGFYPEERRFYPQHSIAAQVLGYAGVDNHGLSGLELSLDRPLAGRAGRETLVRDPFGHVLDSIVSASARDGSDVSLTINQNIQSTAESVLRETVQRWHAKDATAIVLDPHTGAVLAMAVAPTYDANNFPGVSKDLQRNRAITDTYEPGSTFKLVTVAGALSTGIVTPRTAFPLPYEIQVADRRIHDAEPRGTETMSVAMILSKSSNVGAITLARLLGKDRLMSWISRFGFGRPTGIDFPGESQGIVLPADKWSGSTIGNVPIGQGIAVTPMQMASAYAAIANRGLWTRPHVVDRVADGVAKRVVRRRVVTRWIARELTSMLQNVVLDGTGTLAQIPGYHVAGKTGTAAKPDPHGGYSTSRYVASFVGFAPATRPRVVVLVTVDEPHGAIWGGVVAAPAFKAIMQQTLQYLSTPPDAPGSTTSTPSAP
jgi:cell division protein FtsI (penicillin-binding protein 3)